MSNKKITDVQKDEIVKVYLSGKNSREIGLTYNVTNACILYILNKRGVKIRHGRDAKKCYYINENYFKKINSERKAYYLGLFYADGYISKNGKIFQMSLSGDDELILLKKLKDDLEYSGPLLFRKTKEKYKKCHLINICNLKFCSFLIKKGCFNKKSLTLKFPTFNQVPKHLLNHFIRGYFDGDGSVSFRKDKTLICGITSSTFFIEELSKHLHSANIINNYADHHSKNPHIKDLKISKIIGLDFYNFIYKDATIFLDRKKKVFDSYICFLKEKIKDESFLTRFRQITLTRLGKFFSQDFSSITFNLKTSEKEKIISLYNKKYSIRQISRALNKRSQSTVRKFLISLNLDVSINKFKTKELEQLKDI